MRSRRPVRVLLAAALLLGVLPTISALDVTGASAQTEEAERMRVYVGDGVLAEPEDGTAMLRFPLVISNNRPNMRLRYSTVLRGDDTAEAEDFVEVVDKEVSLGLANSFGADVLQVLPGVGLGNLSPVAVEVRADGLDEEAAETLSVEVEAVDDFDVVEAAARGYIVDDTLPVCVFDPVSGTVTVVEPTFARVGPLFEHDHAIEISVDTDGETILAGTAGTDCVGGTPTVHTVDLIELVDVSSDVRIDLSNGPLAPGIDHDGTYVDLLADPGVTPPSADTGDTVPGIDVGSVELEDDTPEIEVAVRWHAQNDFAPGFPSLRVVGSDDPERPDHVVAGWRGCSGEVPPDPRCWPLNLNLNGDGDADVRAAGWNPYVSGSNDQPDQTAWWVNALEIRGGGGDDVLSLAGGHGTGRPIIPKIDFAEGSTANQQSGVDNTIVNGGAGDDVLVGGATGDEIHGGPGDDVLSGGLGLGNVLFGESGDDVFDQGSAPDSADEMSGGDGHDVVDYSRRRSHVVAVPGDNPTEDAPSGDGDLRDDGEDGEDDNIHPDVEDVLFPPVATPDPVRGLDVLGELPAPDCDPEAYDGFQVPRGPCSMVVDTERNLAITVGEHPDPSKPGEPLVDGDYLFVYDLDAVPGYLATKDPEASAPFAHAPLTLPTSRLIPHMTRAVVDSERMRVYGPLRYPGGWAHGSHGGGADPVNDGTCSVPFVEYRDPAHLDGEEFELHTDVLVYADEADCSPTLDAGTEIPLTGGGASVFAPGSRLPLKLFGVALDAPRDDLYLTGEAGVDTARRLGDGANRTMAAYSENGFPAMLLRKVQLDADDPDQAVVDWDLDLRYVGCGRRNPQRGVLWGDTLQAAFVGRVGDDLLAYCWDARPLYWSDFMVGEQGYLVRIPLDPETGKPLPREGTGELVTDTNGAFVNFRAVRTPTLVGQPRVLHDPASDSLLLVTDDPVNGNAVYVFDPASDALVGVATGGNVAQPVGNTAVGVNSDLGRVYLLTAEGVVMFPTRERPLPGGRLFPVAANNPLRPYEHWVNSTNIAVAPASGLLVIPVNLQFADGGGIRYLVAQDRVAESLIEPRDPDANTVQVDEGAGTEVRSFAEARASGVHVVYAGGPVRTVDSADPGCSLRITASEGFVLEFSVERELFGNGECVADQVLASGNREFTLAGGRGRGLVGDLGGCGGLGTHVRRERRDHA